jgi:serine/threonine protein kinase/tetratricopeptide (TPR) repeat protein
VDSDRWQRAKDLFGSALEREPGQRGAFLAQACGGDETLRQEIESLLAAHEEAGTTVGAAAGDSLSGRRIGPYQLMRRIGQGGMAMVYLATRADDQYKKRVAIKLILPGLHTDDLLRRFRNERQTLAALDHPNIVKLLDGGETEDRLPYLVMDYVEGTPITDYCDARRLPTTERLLLFRAVCGAISYAHQRLVIHRDLKPGNLLVTADGNPKLLDFGIAKLLNPEAAATLVVTRTGQRFMTPDYASPEQVRGESLTNGTDVYSLGVVLYELLTGHRPHRLKTQSPSEIERAICEEEPVKPSTAVTRSHERTTADGTSIVVTPEAVSRTREGDPKKLSSRLHGDLDAIVMMALRKEPQRRYSSVYEFSEDIRRHLEGLPVKARPSTVSYRTSKFVRRHKEAAGLAFLVFVLAAGATVWLQVESRSHSKAEAEPPRIFGLKPRRSIAVLGFKNLSGRADTEWLSTALSEMLDTELGAGEQMRTVPGELVAQSKHDLSIPDTDALAPATLAKLGNRLDTDLVVLGSHLELANGQIRLDLRLQDTQKGQTIAEAVETGTEANLFDLIARTGADLRERLGISGLTPAQTLSVRGSVPLNPEAVQLYAEGIERLRLYDALTARELLQRAVSVDPGYAQAHSALAEAWSKLGFEEHARQEAKQAVDLSLHLLRQDRLWIEGQYREITRDWQKATEVYTALYLLFPDNIEYGLRLASVQTKAHNRTEALETLRSLRQSPAPAGNDPRIDLAEVNEAYAFGDFKGEYAAATRAMEKAQAQGAAGLLAEALYDKGDAYLNLGELQAAVTTAEQARQIYATVGDQLGVSNALIASATALVAEGKTEGAMHAFEESLAICKHIGNRHGEATALNQMANLLYGQGHFTSAAQTYEQVLAIERDRGDRQSEANALGNLASVIHDTGDLAKAKKMYEEAETLSRLFGDQSGLAVALFNLGQVLFEQGEIAGARKRYDESLAIFRKAGNKSFETYPASGLADLLKAQGRLDQARQGYAEALHTREGIGAQGDAADSRESLAEVALEQGRVEEAERLAREAGEEFRKEALGDKQVAVQALLARVLLREGKVAEASKEIEAFRVLFAHSQKQTVRFEFELAEAGVLAARGESAKAHAAFDTLLRDARPKGYVGYELEARLGLGKTDMVSGQIARGRPQLGQLAEEAEAKGFGLIARKARDATK